MGLIFTDSVDHYGSLTQKWYSGGSFTPQPSSGGRFNTNGLGPLTAFFPAVLRFTNVNDPLNGVGPQSMVIGLAVKPTAAGNLLSVASLEAGSTWLHLTVGLTPGGEVCVVGGHSFTVATTTYPSTTGRKVPFGRYSFIEIKFTLGNSGTIEWRLDGEPVESWSGDFLNLKPGIIDALPRADQVSFACGMIDDLYILDPSLGERNIDYLGDVRVECIFPNAPGIATELAVYNAAENYQAVDEQGNPNDETDYVAGADVSSKDLYNYTDLATTSGAVKAAVPMLRAREDTEGVNAVRGIIRIGNGEALADAVEVVEDYRYYPSPIDTNPITGADFTIADINDGQLGVQIAADSEIPGGGGGGGNPPPYNPGPIDPNETTVRITGNATVPDRVVIGATVTVTIQARSTDGRPLTVGGAMWEVVVTGANPSGGALTVTDHNNGTYTATYTATNAGTDSVAIAHCVP